MTVLFKNNAHSTLASSITDSATSITLASGHGNARFPVTASPNYFYATLIDGSNNLEVVKCTARSSDVLTVVRAQEGTSARAYSTGDRVELRITAQGLEDLNGTRASEYKSDWGSSSAPITHTVTVGTKTGAHPYTGVGSSDAYFIDNIESPVLAFDGADTGKTYYYRFDQSDSSNSGHPLLFYLNAAKSTAYTTNVTTNGTPGSSGAYTQIQVDEYTPNLLYYQCSSHAHMGNYIHHISNMHNSNGVLFKMPTADGSAGQILKTDGSGVLSFIAAATATYPTVTGVTPSATGNTAANLVIAGTNFVITPQVEFINSSGVITLPNSITRDSATQLTVNATLPTDGTYFIRVENPDGLAARSSSAILTVSDAPTWSTSAGSLGSVAAGASASFSVTATSDSTVAYSETTSVLTSNTYTPASTMNLTLNSSTGAITGTAPAATSETTYNFTLRATDAESQTADRAFSITVSVGMNNSACFTN